MFGEAKSCLSRGSLGDIPTFSSLAMYNKGALHGFGGARAINVFASLLLVGPRLRFSVKRWVWNVKRGPNKHGPPLADT